jgi:hypothetical protein
MAGRRRLGHRVVPIEQIVGSVDRARAMRSDFFYRGRALTARFTRIGEALKQGKPLPPIELYQLKAPPRGTQAPAVSEYYVLDGHHRVAMARQLGQAYIEANVEAYRAADARPAAPGAADPTGEPAPPAGVPGAAPPDPPDR